MTVNELIEVLEKFKDDGKGDYEVVAQYRDDGGYMCGEDDDILTEVDEIGRRIIL